MESTEQTEQKQTEPETPESKTDSAGETRWCGLESRHSRHPLGPRGDASATCPGVDDSALPEPPADDLGTYTAMIDQYRADQKHWIGPAQLPLVFHIRKLCQKLDADPDAPASLSSAYLQALHRLERQRPGSKEPAGAAGDLPGQGSIFDELD